ncbi:hypothetical protein EIP86_001412 [Pleurotus ostreatoroseus]|nr:hypothetical protein EIP86_001412 [Pleurotus ostreatoroseus]
MSLISANKVLVRDLWPAEIPRARNDNKPYDKLDGKEVAPDTLDDMMAWAWVKDRGYGIRNRWSLMHAVGDPDSLVPLHEVAFRVQGFVVDMDLSVLGDWNRQEHGAAAARQFLVIDGGQHADIFAKQVDTLNLVRQLVARSTKSKDVQEQGRKRIHIYRPVFTKRMPGSEDSGCLSKDDDPSGQARRMRMRWIVSDKLVFGALSAQGQLQAASAGKIKKGDFVDVKIIPEIFSPKGAASRDAKVSFKMTRIVKLQSKTAVAPAVAQTVVEKHAVTAVEQDEWDKALGASEADTAMKQD